MVGVIDEIRIPATETDRNPILVDTKTRVRDTLPAEPQRRNGRYEFQKDNSLLGEDQFAFDSDWLKTQLHGCLEFWLGEREACYTPEEERWKCRFCQFASICPTNNGPDSTPSSTETNSTSTLS
uniref:PD-(D/E)XK endonuclease-like domain-containing protein n=1 Tax=Fagus sylvatica TaxID=28930 RepID=A0A2N9FG99_FAGSY